MQTYLLSLLGGALAAALVGILAPEGASRHIRLVSSLFLICVLVAPLPKAIGSVSSWFEELEEAADAGESGGGDYAAQLEAAMESASRSYFAQSLTQMLEQRFSIPAGEIRCTVRWQQGEELRPERVTLVLSGSAIWKNPAEMEEFVTGLLGCECVTAIE